MHASLGGETHMNPSNDQALLLLAASQPRQNWLQLSWEDALCSLLVQGEWHLCIPHDMPLFPVWQTCLAQTLLIPWQLSPSQYYLHLTGVIAYVYYHLAHLLVVRGLLKLALTVVSLEPLVTYCNKFVRHFAVNTACIHAGLDCRIVTVQSLKALTLPSVM